MRRSQRYVAWGGIVLGVVSVASVGAILHLVQRATDGLEGRYAAMQFAYILADYIVDSEGEWPRSWDDFKVAFDHSVTSGDQTYEAWRAGIEPFVLVEWGVDLAELRVAESPQHSPYPVVRVVKGGLAGPTEWHEANAIIFRAFGELHQTRGHDESRDSNVDTIRP